MSARSIAGKTVIVTGAASGIGRATALLFAAQGARVVAADRAPADDLVTADDAAHGGELHVWRGDLADRDGPAELARFARDRVGPVDVLVNNAGVSGRAPIDGDDWPELWDRCLAVNLTAYARMVRVTLDDLRRNGEGRIVMTASTEGLGATPGISPYTASKHGVVGLVRSLAVELGRSGVTVNCVCPGPIRTGMTARIPDEHKDRFARRRVPVGRYGEPEELAHAILHLALPASSYINGAVLPVDGGMMAQNT